MISSIISIHPVTLITMCVPQIVSQCQLEWCRILAAPDRFLGKSRGEQKMIIEFFVQRPVRRLSVCMYVCMYVRIGAGLTDDETLVLVGYILITENKYNLFGDTCICSLLGFAETGWRIYHTVLRSAYRRSLEEIQ